MKTPKYKKVKPSAITHSRKIRLTSGAVAAQQFSEFGVDGPLGPGDEVAPSVFQLPPDDLNLVELGTVGRQIEQGAR
nr:hypothetical protein [Burkholderia ubonensis]